MQYVYSLPIGTPNLSAKANLKSQSNITIKTA